MAYFGKATKAKEETDEKTATEIMNLKITNVQMQSYAEKQENLTLQYLADKLCEDDEIEYVCKQSKKTASLDPIQLEETDKVIYTKLKEYPYEFEIDRNPTIKSINGIEVTETTNKDEIINNQEINKQIEEIKLAIKDLQEDNQNLRSKLDTLEKETIVGKKIKLTNDNFTPIVVPLTTDFLDKKFGAITLKDAIEQYKYIEIQAKLNYKGGYTATKSVFIATETVKYHNSDTIDHCNGTSYYIDYSFLEQNYSIGCYFKNNKELVLGSSAKTNITTWNHVLIFGVYGIK